MGTVPSPTLLQDLQRPVSDHREERDTSITLFHVTGFQRFHNVPVNPTELVVRALPKHLSGSPLSDAASLASSRVLKVSAKTTRTELSDMYASLPVPSPSSRTVFLHLGVNVSVDRFFLEVQARNEATFSCPDELGWTPIKHPIDSANQDISATRTTTLALDPLLDRLRVQGFKVDLSMDAGRFVCNWVYYNSLEMAQAQHCDVSALFVHVPPVSVVPVHTQTRFLAALMDAIAELP